MTLSPNELVRELDSLITADANRRKSTVQLLNDTTYYERRLGNAVAAVEAARTLLARSEATLAEIQSIPESGIALLEELDHRIHVLTKRRALARHQVKVEQLLKAYNEINDLESQDESEDDDVE